MATFSRLSVFCPAPLAGAMNPAPARRVKGRAQGMRPQRIATDRNGYPAVSRKSDRGIKERP